LSEGARHQWFLPDLAILENAHILRRNSEIAP
jgi:hypothetical protein